MSKKTTGIDDLIKYLIKQHGLEGAIDRARNMALDRDLDIRRKPIWRAVYHWLKDMR